MADSRLAAQPGSTGVSPQIPAAVKKHGGTKWQCKGCMSKSRSTTNTSTTSSHPMLTRCITTSVSRNAVFNTLELLENILLHLPNKDLIFARLVNKHWNALAMTSPRLQRKLFLLAEQESTTWILDTKKLIIMEGEDASLIGLPDTEWTVPAKLNGLLFTRQPTSLQSSIQSRVMACEPVSLLARPDLALHGSIYHRMLVSQPPSKEVQFEFYFDKSQQAGRRGSRYYGDAKILLKVANSSGVTFGDILRKFRNEIDSDNAEEQRNGYLIKVASSTLWMAGVVFATDEEAAMVKKVQL